MDNITKEIAKAGLSRVRRSMRRVEKEAKVNLIRMGKGRVYKIPGTEATYVASAPGDPPAALTATLVTRLKVTTKTKAGQYVKASVGTIAPHGLLLEFGTGQRGNADNKELDRDTRFVGLAPRPWLYPAYLKMKAEIMEIMNEGWF